MPLPALAPVLAGLLSRAGGTAALGAVGRQLGTKAASGAATQGAAATAQRVTVNFADKGLFKKAFTSQGVQTSTDIAAQQQREETEQRQSQARAALFQHLTRAVTGSVVAMVGMPLALKKFSTGLIDAQRNLARYSAAHALAQMKLERGRLGREIGHAQGTGTTATMLANAVNGLEQELAPLKTALANVTNVAGTLAAFAARGGIVIGKIVTGFATLESIYKALQNIPWLKKWFAKPQQNQPWEQLLGAIADGVFDRRKQPPPPRRPAPPRRKGRRKNGGDIG